MRDINFLFFKRYQYNSQPNTIYSSLVIIIGVALTIATAAHASLVNNSVTVVLALTSIGLISGGGVGAECGRSKTDDDNADYFPANA